MENAQQLAHRFRSVFLDGRWIAQTNYQEQLTTTDWKQATQKIGTLNSIAALTFHVNYYQEGIIQVFEGGGLEIRDQFSFDLKPITAASDWADMVQTFLTNAEKFAQHVEFFSPEKLNSVFVDEKYGTYRRNIEGVIEHAYYHLGQMVLLKKWITTA